MRLRLRSLIERLRSSLFLVPMAAVVVAIGAGLGSVVIDSRLDENGADLPLVLASTVESARALLSTIAGATITFAGIAFSVSLLVIQLASTQFSPRVVHTLFRDPFNRRVMGLVVGTFTYCVMVLRSVRSPLEEGGDPVIPNLSMSVAVALGIAAILGVIAFINHNAHAMDVSEILERVKRDAMTQIREEWAPTEDAEPPSPGPASAVTEARRCVRFDRSGWIQMIDTGALLRCAPDGATIVVHTFAGRYAVEGSRFCTIAPGVPDDMDATDDDIRAAVALGDTRTMQQDVSYGLRQLADVALRALSPGVNDPTTAQDSILHATALLAELLRRSPPGPVRDGCGRTLVFAEAPNHVGLIRLTFEETRRAAAGLPTFCVYLLEALSLLTESVGSDLTDAARNEIADQARLVVAGSERSDPLAADLAAVREAYRTRFG